MLKLTTELELLLSIYYETNEEQDAINFTNKCIEEKEKEVISINPFVPDLEFINRVRRILDILKVLADEMESSSKNTRHNLYKCEGNYAKKLVVLLKEFKELDAKRG